jgi:hypothetical protein
MKPSLIAAFFRPSVVFPIPKGITPDVSGANGLFGLMQNVNVSGPGLGSVATAGTAITLIPAQLLSGVVQLNSGNAGAFTVTLPGTGAILAALGATVQQDGTFFDEVSFLNNSGALATLVAGDGGTTIVGPGTIASNVMRSYMMQILGSATLSLTNLGQRIL